MRLDLGWQEVSLDELDGLPVERLGLTAVLRKPEIFALLERRQCRFPTENRGGAFDGPGKQPPGSRRVRRAAAPRKDVLRQQLDALAVRGFTPTEALGNARKRGGSKRQVVTFDGCHLALTQAAELFEEVPALIRQAHAPQGSVQGATPAIFETRPRWALATPGFS